MCLDSRAPPPGSKRWLSAHLPPPRSLSALGVSVGRAVCPSTQTLQRSRGHPLPAAGALAKPMCRVLPGASGSPTWLPRAFLGARGGRSASLSLCYRTLETEAGGRGAARARGRPAGSLQLLSPLAPGGYRQGGLEGRPPRKGLQPHWPVGIAQSALPSRGGDSHWLWNPALHIGASSWGSSGPRLGLWLRTQQGP